MNSMLLKRLGLLPTEKKVKPKKKGGKKNAR